MADLLGGVDAVAEEEEEDGDDDDEEELEGLLAYLVTDEKGMQFLLPSSILPRISSL